MGIVYPIISKVLYIPGGAGFFPSTVSAKLHQTHRFFHKITSNFHHLKKRLSTYLAIEICIYKYIIYIYIYIKIWIIHLSTTKLKGRQISGFSRDASYSNGQKTQDLFSGFPRQLVSQHCDSSVSSDPQNQHGFFASPVASVEIWEAFSPQSTPVSGLKYHPTWRIIPISKWLITMVNKSPM